MADTIRKVVRKIGAGVVHVADVHPDQLFAAQLMGPPCLYAETPVATVCGRVLRGEAVCMKDGTPVKCTQCRRMTSVAVAREGNDGEGVEPLRSARVEYAEQRAARRC